ncbi:ABC transporter permease [Neiella marina]|uniref:ABC transporter permease n=1 Tax=Neiella holothuriorum TaxID=2870530 RepID=A0ABS7EDU2_9GAMM|nr:FtsX-like permease family protein [Neiella holothuriorum]MBW8190497.1 ABC transporter permease [Neiella holothuriorum]
MNIKALIKSLLHRRFATFLLILQLALTLGLVVNSSIMALDTNAQMKRKLGFDKDELLIVQLLPTSGAFRDEDFYRSVLHQDIAKLSALPGVTSVSQLNQLPIQWGGWNGSVIKRDEPEKLLENRQLNFVPYYFSSNNIFETLGLHLVEGRLFDEASPQMRDQETPSTIITQSLARELFGNESAIGQEINAGFVVGIVSDFVTMPGNPEEKQYAVFYNEDLAIPDIPQNYLLRVAPEKLQTTANLLEDALLSVHPERDILEVFSMVQHHQEFYQEDNGLVGLFTILCVLMLIVTAISSFAHAQFHVFRQRRLIGIRRALGATRKDILFYVMAEHWLITLLGSVLGVAVMLAINIGLSGQIDISKPNVLLYLAAFVIVFVSGSLSTWFPAWRTSLIPPVIATRTV